MRKASRYTFHHDGRVTLGGVLLGYVWKSQGFTYRGEAGHWRCGPEINALGIGGLHRTRQRAAGWLEQHHDRRMLQR